MDEENRNSDYGKILLLKVLSNLLKTFWALCGVKVLAFHPCPIKKIPVFFKRLNKSTSVSHFRCHGAEVKKIHVSIFFFFLMKHIFATFAISGSN